MLTLNENIVSNPGWGNHCIICGEYEERKIVDLPDCGPICDICIKEESDRYETLKWQEHTHKSNVQNSHEQKLW